MLFYKPSYYLHHLGEIPHVWEGGMSFHGGFLGVLVAMIFFARKTGRTFFEIADFVAPYTGTYYISVPGNDPQDYSLVLTRNAGLETKLTATSTPPTGERKRTGVNCSALTMPRWRGECVSSSTSHDWVTVCIQLQVCDTIVPAK